MAAARNRGGKLSFCTFETDGLRVPVGVLGDREDRKTTLPIEENTVTFIPQHGAWRRLALAITLSSAFAGTMTMPVLAQNLPRIDLPDVEAPDVDDTADDLPDAKGALVFHGNYCGPGSRGVGRAPVDALDAACMHHDACSPKVGTGLPSCGCNARLAREASLVARSPRTDAEQRVAAEFVAEGAKVLACR